MKKYIPLIISILALCVWAVRESHAWPAVVEFDPPLDLTDITEVLVSNVSGDYSQAYGQRSEPGVSNVKIGGFDLSTTYYLVARRLNESGEYSSISNEIEFIPCLVDESAGKIIATWEHSGPSNGYRLYMDEGYGEDLIWEGIDGGQRSAEIICTVYEPYPIDFIMTAYQGTNESDFSGIFQATSDRTARNVFQLLPWNARKRLCGGVKPSEKLCFLCHNF